MPMTHQSGFTLIEVLLAMAITVIVALVAYQALDNVMRIVESQKQQQKQAKAINSLFAVLQKDFQQMIPRKVRQPAGNGFKDALFFNPQAEPMLEFTIGGWNNPIPWRLQRSHLRRIGFHLQDEKLIRYDWPVVDRYEETKVIKTTLYKGVKTLKIRFLQKQSSQQTESGQPNRGWKWVKKWPPGQTDQDFVDDTAMMKGNAQLPLAIELEMELENYGFYKRVIMLPEANDEKKN